MLCVIRYRFYNLKNVKNTDWGGLLLVKLDSIFLVVIICFIVPIAKSYLVVTDLFYVKISEPVEVNSEINFLFKKTLYVFYFNCLAFYVLTNMKYPAVNYMFSRNTRTRCEICSRLTIKTPIGVVLVSLLLTLDIFHTLL